MNHYEILGVGPEATATEIRAAYRALSKEVHPDAGGDDYQFGVLEHSYRVLSDPRARARHDRELRAGAGPATGRAGVGRSEEARRYEPSGAETVAGRPLGGCLEQVAGFLVLGVVWLIITGLVLATLSLGGNPSAALRSGSIVGWLLIVAALVVGVVARLRRRS